MFCVGRSHIRASGLKCPTSRPTRRIVLRNLAFGAPISIQFAHRDKRSTESELSVRKDLRNDIAHQRVCKLCDNNRAAAHTPGIRRAFFLRLD